MTIYDLSLDVYPGMPVFPGTPPVGMLISHTIEKANYRLGQAVVNTHAGTHTDAPSHFLAGAPGLEGVDITAYVGKALVVDCSSKKAKEPITPADLGAYEDRIRKGTRVLIRTDWFKFAREDFYFTDYPPISLELARWLVERGVVLIGVEPPSLNPGQYIEVHQAFLRAGVAVVEGLANLDRLKTDEVFFVAAPLRFQGADGFPVRALAIEFPG